MKLEELRADWTPPDGLGYSSLRPVRLTGAGYAMAVMALVFWVGGVVLCATLWHQSDKESRRRVRLERDGVETTATVARMWQSGEDRTPHVGYRFRVAGEEISGSAKMPRRLYSTMKKGDSLAVRYVPEDPEINHPVEWRMDVMPRFLPFVTPWGLVFPGVLFPFLIRRQWRLLSEGRPAPGVIVKARRRDKYVALQYDFRLLSGAVVRGKSKCSNTRVVGEGAQVCVLYDPDNPRRSAVYPLNLVRLEGQPAWPRKVK